MINSTEAFKQFQPMIEGAAWKAHKHYHIDIEELHGQAYLVFCEAIERYDPNKATFSTYLFSRLRTVKDYASQLKKIEEVKTIPLQFISTNEADVDDEHGSVSKIFEKSNNGNINPESNISDTSFEQFEAAMDRLETALELSEDAQDIIDFLFSREWETPGINRVPRLYTVKKYYRYWKGWKAQRTERAWKEIRDWWQSGNHFLQEA